MTMRLTFGIDPGLTGAIATLIDGEPGPFLDMPTRKVGDWGEVDADKLAAFIREQRAAHRELSKLVLGTSDIGIGLFKRSNRSLHHSTVTD